MKTKNPPLLANRLKNENRHSAYWQRQLLFFVIVLLWSCEPTVKQAPQPVNNPPVKTVELSFVQVFPTTVVFPWHLDLDTTTALMYQIPTPKDYHRVNPRSDSFAEWLQYLPLFPKGQKVFTYDGNLKWNQQAHERVIDIDIGKRDLQQCADAVIRLRSEFLYSKKEYSKIHFKYTNGTKVSFDDWRNGRKPSVNGNKVIFSNTGKKDSSYESFKKYLIQIFSYAGTAFLEKEIP